MKNNTTHPKNGINRLLKKHKKSARWLAGEVGITPAQVSRVANRKSGLTTDMALRIAGALDVNANEVFDVSISKKLSAGGDDTLLGSALGWLMEEANRQKLHLSRRELSYWTSYIYKEALKQSLNFGQTKRLTSTIIKVLKIERKK